MLHPDATVANMSQEALDELFFEVLELPSKSRDDWLAEHCNGEQGLIDEILSLAAAHEQSGNFLSDTQAPGRRARNQVDYSGKRFGPWALQSIIGQGGMGDVYSALRCDGRYEQTVAVKVGPAVGLQSTLFNRERQVLANLDHPVITKILDAGEIPDSDDAYLVMEFVDGRNLIDYVTEHNELTDVDRAGLISTILEALHQAHTQGVIHCDIKPENILVDKVGKVKLLDFGIAKTLDEETDSDDGLQLRGITPAYASPQRLEGSLPTVSDDIYGVGLLFGLIMPAALERVVRTDLPLNEQIPQLTTGLKKEIKSIFLAATASKSEERYPTAKAFLDDIRAWVEHNPVAAHKAGPFYRIGKLFQRHRFLSVSAILFTGVFTISMFAWYTYKEKQQFEAMQQQQLEAALQLSKNISEGLDFRFSQLPGSLPARLSTAESAIQQIEQIRNRQPDNADIAAALAQAYLRLANFNFLPTALHIGDVSGGYEALTKAYNLAYDAYKLKRNVKNLTLLSRATNYITVHLMVTQNDWSSSLPYLDNIFDEYKYLDAKDSISRVNQRTQIYLFFRIHMINGDYKAARETLDAAMAIKYSSEEKMSNYEKNRINVHQRRTLELNAIYAMVTGDLDTARTTFSDIASRFEDHKTWKDKRRSLYAYRSLACIAMNQSQPNYRLMTDNLHKARAVARSLAQSFPNAVSMQWEFDALASIDQFSSSVEKNSGNNRLTDHSKWAETFNCHQPFHLHRPAAPAASWNSIISKSEISLKDVLKKL